MKKEKTKQIWVNAKLHKAVKIEAAKLGITMCELVERIIEEGLKKK